MIWETSIKVKEIEQEEEMLQLLNGGQIEWQLTYETVIINLLKS